MKLYIYDHCPYCVKARMIFGFKKVKFELITLLNDDEKTPISMIGKKMVPILETDEGNFMPESMDIVYFIDQNFGGKRLIVADINPKISQWLGESKDYVYKLAMPRWVKADLEEFETQGAIDYFTKKKGDMIGSFEDNLAQSEELIARANSHLKALDELIMSPHAVNGSLSEDDINLFPTLRSLSIVKGIEFPENVLNYIKTVAKNSEIPLHLDIAL